MRQYSLLSLFTLITLFFISSCKKESPSTLTAPPPKTIILNASAGSDDWIFLPTNYCTLNGAANYNGTDSLLVVWSKISGPTSFLIEEPNSLRTKVSHLVSGIYRFELAVSANNLTNKDTCTVTVGTTPPPPPPPPPPTSNIPPIVRAGTDKLVYYPTNFTNLYGSVSTWGNVIQTISWKKISGPSSFLIETPNLLGTKVSNLQMGVYQFEVSVQDAAGLSDKDTCTVIVGQISSNPNEMIFQNQMWGNQGAYSTLLWGSSIIIANIYQFLPPGSVFRVYIKRDNSINWVELIMDDYNSYYSTILLDGNLRIWSSYDETDTPDIKLVY